MASSSVFEVVAVVIVLMVYMSSTTEKGGGVLVEATWCVTRSDASEQALQTALDYACGAGADCGPIQSSGLCYLPNTIQAHSSYAFNSYYQRKGNAPGSCDFAGTATIAKTDPSYGSCVYPSSPSTAGGTPTGTNPSSSVPPPPGFNTPLYGSGGLTPGFTPGVGPVAPIADNSKACMEFPITKIMVSISCFLVLLLMNQPM